MILGDVEETITSVELDEETFEEMYKVRMGTGIVTFFYNVSIRNNPTLFCVIGIEDPPPPFFLFLMQSTKRNVPMLFVRGDGVILVSPPIRGSQ